MLDEPAIDKQKLLSAGAARKLRLAHEAAQLDHVGVFVHRDQPLVVFGTKDPHQALSHGARWQVKQLPAIVAQAESAVRMGQGDALEFVNRVAQLDLVALQEIAPRRHVEEQVLDHHSGPDITRHRFSWLELAAFHRQLQAQFVLRPTGAELHPRNARNAREGFAAKPHCGQGQKVVRRAKLGRGVALETQRGILWPHALPIILNGDAVASGILEFHRHTVRPSVQGVFHQFLDHRCRALDDFAGGDLVRHVLGQTLDVGLRRRAHGVNWNSRAKSVVSTHSKPRQAA